MKSPQYVYDGKERKCYSVTSPKGKSLLSSTPTYKIRWCSKKLLIETTKSTASLKQGSPKSLQIIEDVTCDKLSELKKGKLLGKGTQGKVYCYLDECKYVIKIQKSSKTKYEKDYKNLLEEKTKTNKAHKLGFAPKIYKIIRCDDDLTLLVIMDKVPGKTLDVLIQEHKITRQDIQKLFRELDKLHSHGIYHGDLNPSNIIYDGKKFTFIDFYIKYGDYKPVYDSGTIFYFLPFYIDINYEIFEEILRQSLKRLLPIKDSTTSDIVDLLVNFDASLTREEFLDTMKEYAAADFYFAFQE